jgi:hypothetical protein
MHYRVWIADFMRQLDLSYVATDRERMLHLATWPDGTPRVKRYVYLRRCGFPAAESWRLAGEYAGHASVTSVVRHESVRMVCGNTITWA